MSDDKETIDNSANNDELLQTKTQPPNNLPLVDWTAVKNEDNDFFDDGTMTYFWYVIILQPFFRIFKNFRAFRMRKYQDFMKLL